MDVTYAWLTDPECGVLTWLEEVAGLDNESNPAKEALEAAKTAVSTSSKDLADPDAPGGDQAVRTDHDAFWETLWTQVRAGKLEDAMAFCNESLSLDARAKDAVSRMTLKVSLVPCTATLAATVLV